MKLCKKCNNKWPEEFNLCPVCGVELISEQDKNSDTISMGDGNAINGSINVSKDFSSKDDHSVANSNNISNSNNKTTNISSHHIYHGNYTHVEREKTAEEILIERKSKYRSYCKQVISNGPLVHEKKIWLEEQRIELGLSAEMADVILSEVTILRQKPQRNMGQVQRILFDQFKRHVERNDIDNIQDKIEKIGVMANKFRDEDLQYFYYLALSALDPQKCIEIYNKTQEDNYWLSFWTYVALYKCGSVSKAEEVYSDLEANWEELMPSENLVVLAIFGALLEHDQETASELILCITTNQYSSLLNTLIDAISVVIDEEGIDFTPIKSEYRFYLENFFKDIENVNRIKSEEENTKKSDIANNAQELFELAYKYYVGEGVEQDYTKALDLFTKSAAQGNRDAQFALGLMYYNGEGLKQDYTKAFEWFIKSAEQENSDAQCNVGMMYYNGEGVKQDYTRAFEWLTKSAEQDDSDAQYNVGMMYYNGDGVKQDYAKAFEWFTKSAEQEDSDAQSMLGKMYYNGDGVKKNYSKAINLFRKSAENGGIYAAYMLGKMYYEDEGVEDAEIAYKWTKYAAENEDSDAQCLLGHFYYMGHGVEEDEKLALYWYKRSAEQGNSDAQYELGFLYDCGLSEEEQDEELAFKWYEKSAEQGNSDAQCRLGTLYKNVKEDYNLALKWYKISAKQGNPEAMDSLGDMYRDGEGVEKDYKQALEYYIKAAELGDDSYQFQLGEIYYRGELGHKDYIQAVIWLKKAANNGNSSAQHYLTNSSVYKELSQTALWYQKAIQGDMAAQFNLGLMYYKGYNVEEDRTKAFEWLSKSAKQGNEKAIKLLKDYNFKK